MYKFEVVIQGEWWPEKSSQLNSVLKYCSADVNCEEVKDFVK